MAGPSVACYVQINFIPTQGNANLKGRRVALGLAPIRNDRRKTGASFPEPEACIPIVRVTAEYWP